MNSNINMLKNIVLLKKINVQYAYKNIKVLILLRNSLVSIFFIKIVF